MNLLKADFNNVTATGQLKVGGAADVPTGTHVLVHDIIDGTLVSAVVHSRSDEGDLILDVDWDQLEDTDNRLSPPAAPPLRLATGRTGAVDSGTMAVALHMPA